MKAQVVCTLGVIGLRPILLRHPLTVFAYSFIFAVLCATRRVAIRSVDLILNIGPTGLLVSETNFRSQDKNHRCVIQPEKKEHQAAERPIERKAFLSERDLPRETPPRELEEDCPAQRSDQ